MRLAGRDINAAVTQLHGHYGPVFAFGVGPLRFIWLVGPEANRFVIDEAAAQLALGPAYGFLRTVGGDTALITSDEPEHRQRRRLVQPAFHRERLRHLDATIDARLQALFGCLAGHTLDLYAVLRGCVLGLICEVLLGESASRTGLTADIAQMMRFANLPLQLQLLKVPLPATPWTRFTAARRRADGAFYRELAARRARGEPGHDVLGLLLAARGPSGHGLSDTEIRDQAVSLVAAGFETTSAAFVWAVYELLGRPELLAELRGALADDPEPPLLSRVIKETLRLYPAAPAGLRQTTAALEFGGVRIPAGQRVAFSIYATHRLAALYPDPDTFRPERWTGLNPDPYSYLPFGGGRRYCIGASLATRILTLGLARLLRDFELSPAWTQPVTQAGNTLHPRGGLPLRVRWRSGVS